MFKERMTPDELARLTGYSRQTINKWVRKEGWTTSPKPGVQGGKARLVHVNEQVREYIRNAERPEGQGEAPALSGDAPLEVLLVTLAKEMTPVEQKQFTSLLLQFHSTPYPLRLFGTICQSLLKRHCSPGSRSRNSIYLKAVFPSGFHGKRSSTGRC